MKLFAKTLVVALVVSCQLSLAGAAMIDEISVDSIDTVFGLAPSPGALTIAQHGVTVVLERSDNTQQAISGASFSLVTFLQTDQSTGGQAVADFTGGTIVVRDALSVLLLSADIGVFNVQESLNLPFSLLAGSGDFLVTGGTLAADFGPAGDIFDITWELDTNIDDFSQGFTAESDVTLTPEPATMILLGAGAVFARKRRRRS